MKKYVVVGANGEILEEHTGLAPPTPNSGGAVVETTLSFDSEMYWRSGGNFIEKQPFQLTINTTQITADGDDSAAITGVPNGTLVRWPDGQEDEITDGTVEFATDLPGTYTLHFSAVPYLDQEVTIEAVAAT